MTEPAPARLLQIDAQAETDRICVAIRRQIRQLRRRGAVLGVSGGIDSSLCAALCAAALGADRVLALLMPEQDSSPDSLKLGQLLAQHLGIRAIVEDITPTLVAAGCYRRRDEAIRAVIPEFRSGDRSKIALSGVMQSAYNVFSVVTESADGVRRRARLTGDTYLAIVAATNFKQRVRKMMEYHYADRYQFAVIGTPNRLEYDQGFFVKLGDGSADLKPIAHLYKTQVYQLAAHLGIPDEILRRPPTTDTYSLAQSQEEFYFAVPLQTLDLCLYGVNHQLPPDAIASQAGLTPEQVKRIYRDIATKRSVARYLHSAPLTVDPLATAAATALTGVHGQV
jgi:NAD+ synthase